MSQQTKQYVVFKVEPKPPTEKSPGSFGRRFASSNEPFGWAADEQFVGFGVLSDPYPPKRVYTFVETETLKCCGVLVVYTHPEKTVFEVFELSGESALVLAPGQDELLVIEVLLYLIRRGSKRGTVAGARAALQWPNDPLNDQAIQGAIDHLIVRNFVKARRRKGKTFYGTTRKARRYLSSLERAGREVKYFAQPHLIRLEAGSPTRLNMVRDEVKTLVAPKSYL